MKKQHLFLAIGLISTTFLTISNMSIAGLEDDEREAVRRNHAASIIQTAFRAHHQAKNVIKGSQAAASAPSSPEELDLSSLNLQPTYTAYVVEHTPYGVIQTPYSDALDREYARYGGYAGMIAQATADARFDPFG